MEKRHVVRHHLRFQLNKTPEFHFGGVPHQREKKRKKVDLFKNFLLSFFSKKLRGVSAELPNSILIKIAKFSGVT